MANPTRTCNTMAKGRLTKTTNNDRHNTTQKAKGRGTQITPKYGGDL